MFERPKEEVLRWGLRHQDSSDITHVIVQMYQAYFQREPSPADVAAWRDSLSAQAGALVANELAASHEFRERSSSAQVYLLYRTMMRRTPTWFEASPYVDALRTGQMTPADIRAAFAASEEYRTRAHAGRFLSVSIDTISGCNLRCRMCYQSARAFRERPVTQMTAELLRTVSDQVFLRTMRLTLSCGGEPLLSPLFTSAVKAAQSCGVPYIDLVTNGQLLTQDLARTLIDGGVHSIAVSIDGATPTTYEYIRTGASFTRLLDNVRGLQALKRAVGATTPALRINMTLQRRNIREAPALIRLAHELGASHVELHHVIAYAECGTDCEILSSTPALANIYLERARQLADDFSIALVAPALFPPERAATRGLSSDDLRVARENQAWRDLHNTPSRPAPPAVSAPTTAHETACDSRLIPFCDYPFSNVCITAAGAVLPCMFWYNGTSMGTLATQSFDAVWHATPFTLLRTQIMHQALTGPCATCPCSMGRDLNRDHHTFHEHSLGLNTESAES